MSKIQLFSFLTPFVVLVSAFSSFSLAEYEVKLDLTDKKVYLLSGTTKISVENVGDYFSGAVSGT
jgi:hypothetical protein